MYTFIALDVILFGVSVISWYELEADKVSIFTMLSSMILSFKISNLFIDGTLTKTSYFLSSNDSVVPSIEVIRNTAASGIFELFAICCGLFAIGQIFLVIKESWGSEDVEY